MSTKAVTAVFTHSRSKGVARLVLLAMAEESTSQGLLISYRRSHGWLAQKANIQPQNVGRAVRQLCKLGELEVLVRGGGRRSSDYRITLPGLEGPQGETPHAEHPVGGGGLTTKGQCAHSDVPIIPVSPVRGNGTTPPSNEDAVEGMQVGSLNAAATIVTRLISDGQWTPELMPIGRMEQLVGAALATTQMPADELYLALRRDPERGGGAFAPTQSAINTAIKIHRSRVGRSGAKRVHVQDSDCRWSWERDQIAPPDLGVEIPPTPQDAIYAALRVESDEQWCRRLALIGEDPSAQEDMWRWWVEERGVPDGPSGTRAAS